MNKPVVCLYEYTGLSAADWANAGHEVFCYDIQHSGESRSHGQGIIHKVKWDATNRAEVDEIMEKFRESGAALVMCFPPCTDLAVSGAAHFANKAKADPLYRQKAMDLVYVAREIAEAIGAPYFIENPVSVISTEWRKPDFVFHPYEFGGYLPEDDVHPLFPYYIAPRDAYPKKTCLWTGGGFSLPMKKPVECRPGYSDQHLKLGGKSLRTKNIRSATPRGIMRELHITPVGGEGKTVEADETYIGNKGKQNPGARGFAHKEKVFSLVERGGRVQSYHVERVNAETLKPIMQKQLDASSRLMTDEARQYIPLGKDYAQHHVVQHGIGEYVRGDVHTNTIEGYFSIFKRGMKGVYQHCSARHLKRYLAEFDFRYNERELADSDRMAVALAGIQGKRVTYRDSLPG